MNSASQPPEDATVSNTLPLQALIPVSLLLIGGVIGLYFQGPAIRAHFNNIVSGKVDALKASYSDKAVLDWVGGPLDGVYTGANSIGGVWT